MIIFLFIFESFIKTLDISEDALPIWFFHHDHVINIQEGIYSSFLICHSESEIKIVATILRFKFIKVKGIWVEVVNESAEGHTVIPTCAEVLNLYSLGVRGVCESICLNLSNGDTTDLLSALLTEDVLIEEVVEEETFEE